MELLFVLIFVELVGPKETNECISNLQFLFHGYKGDVHTI